MAAPAQTQSLLPSTKMPTTLPTSPYFGLSEKTKLLFERRRRKSCDSMYSPEKSMRVIDGSSTHQFLKLSKITWTAGRVCISQLRGALSCNSTTCPCWKRLLEGAGSTSMHRSSRPRKVNLQDDQVLPICMPSISNRDVEWMSGTHLEC